MTQESQDLQAKVASKEEIIQAQVSEVIKSCFMPIAQCTQFPGGLFSSRDKRKNLSKQFLLNILFGYVEKILKGSLDSIHHLHLQ